MFVLSASEIFDGIVRILIIKLLFCVNACFMVVESPVRVEKSVGPHVNHGKSNQ